MRPSPENAARPLKAFTAGFGTETNSFSSIITDLAAFERTFLYRPGEHPEALTEVSAPLFVLRERQRQQNWRIVEGTYAFALPAGTVTKEAYESLRDEILQQLADGAPYDLVALSLHGAMCASDYDDCEGDLLTHVRRIVGASTPIGVEFDPHAHLTSAMIENADILIAFKEYPHTDFLERGVELIDLLEKCARTRWRPAKRVFDCRTIGRFHTTREPMKRYVRAMSDAESQPGIASISLIHGFPWGDVADMGAKCLVLADSAELAERTAREFGEQLIRIRARTFMAPLSLEDALAAAMESTDPPVVIGDIADNPGGGAGGDSTRLLRLLTERDAPACIGPLWDPEIVGLAHDLGIGGRSRMAIGGKSGAAAGPPLHLDVEVTGLCEEASQTWAGTQMSLGRACALRASNVQIMVSSIRDQAYGPDLFFAVGIDAAASQIIAVKSAQHFVAGFSKIAPKVLLASGGGPLEADFRKIPYRKIRRPIWPIDP